MFLAGSWTKSFWFVNDDGLHTAIVKIKSELCWVPHRGRGRQIIKGHDFDPPLSPTTQFRNALLSWYTVFKHLQVTYMIYIIRGEKKIQKPNSKSSTWKSTFFRKSVCSFVALISYEAIICMYIHVLSIVWWMMLDCRHSLVEHGSIGLLCRGELRARPDSYLGNLGNMRDIYMRNLFFASS